MKTELKPAGPFPTFFRAACREVSLGESNGHDRVGHTICGAVAGLLDDDDGRAAKLAELSALICGPGRFVRSLHGFLASPDANAVISWFSRELPRCMALVPLGRREALLRRVYRYVVEEEKDVVAC